MQKIKQISLAMIKVAIFTTVWERPRLTHFHFDWMDRFVTKCKDLGILVRPFYVLSENDGHLNYFINDIERFGHKHTIQPKQRLTVKSQGGLEALRDSIRFSWLMHLDSDEILSYDLMKRWKQEFDKDTLWFGSGSCYFVDSCSGKAWEFQRYSDHPIKNGGTCIHRSILDQADWTLWPVQRDMGLNVMERKTIENLGYQVQPINTQNIYGVVEIKGGDNAIHNLDWFHKKRLLEELNERRHNELLQHHPMLRHFV